MELLEKTRQINRLLQKGDKVEYYDIAKLLCSIIKANTYIVGNGCGITYLKYRKSKRAEELDCAAGDIRNNEVQNILISMLPRADYSYLKSIGCPFEAIWCQMQKLQNKYYMLVVNFAQTKKKKMQIVSYID